MSENHENMEFTDPATGRKYHVDAVTGETVWNTPEKLTKSHQRGSIPTGVKVVITAVSSFIVGIAIGAASNGSDSVGSVTPSPAATVTAAGKTVTATPTVTKTIKVTPKPKVAFGEGVWLVGEDIAPGTYRTIATVDVECYWEILAKPGSDNIIDNAIVTGGRPTVVLKAGQQFTNDSCGDWTKK